jgi:hypothetical protein
MLLLLAALALGWAGPTAGAEPPLDELMRRLASVQQSRASFTEQKDVTALTAPVRTQGRLAYRRPDYLEKVTAPPNPETLVVEGSNLTFAVGEEAPRRIDLDQEPALRALVDTVRGTLSGDLDALRRGYTVTMGGDLDAWRLTMVPRDPAVARLLRQVVIEGIGTDLRVVSIAQANGDSSVMTIEPDR